MRKHTYLDLEALSIATNAMASESEYIREEVSTLYPDNSAEPVDRAQILDSIERLEQLATQARAALLALTTED